MSDESTANNQPSAPSHAWRWISSAAENIVFFVVVALLVYTCRGSGPSSFEIQNCASACGDAGVQSVTDAACTCKGAEDDSE